MSTLTLMGAGPEAGGAAAASAYSQAVLADSPISYWQFKETGGTTAADSGSGGNTGTYTGGVTLNQAGAVTGGRSILLDGTSGYVNVPHNANLAIVGDLTLEAWVKPTDLTSFWFIISKNVTNTGRPYEYRIDQTTGKLNFLRTAGPPAQSTTALTAGAWAHVAVKWTVAGTAITYYLNGSPDGTSTLAAGTDGGTALQIGTRADFLSFFKGSIAEPAVYNTALADARILAHWNAR